MHDDFKNRSLSECLELIGVKKLTWIAKRLSGNDTGLTKSHQVGVYFPKWYFQGVFPEIYTKEKYKPKVGIDCMFPHNGADPVELVATYYNSKHFPELGLLKKYDEFRLTKWGGKSSPVQNPENTGSILLLATCRDNKRLKAVAIVAENEADENLIEEWLGREVEPSIFLSSLTHSIPDSPSNKLPESWLTEFPSGEEIFAHVLKLLPRIHGSSSPGRLLLERRKLEFEIFSKIEQAHILPQIQNGFSNMDSFMTLALSVANRRKARTGNSLELNLASIFTAEGIRFDSQKVTENKKKPDFLFPSAADYRNPIFPSERLTMLAAKTCCKDRWRQVLSEADRIEKKHLFTLQEGVTTSQLEEMAAKQLTLVVPDPNLKSFPDDWKKRILTLSSFIDVARERQAS